MSGDGEQGGGGGGGKKPDEPVTWETIEEVAAQAELDRWKAMSDEEVGAALEAEKVDPARLERLKTALGAGAGASAGAGAGAGAGASADASAGASAGAGASGGETPGGKVVQLDQGRRRRGRWAQATLLLVAAAAAVFLWFRGSDDDHKVGAPPPPPSAQARELREAAFAACDKSEWETCRTKLDEARELDPGGEDSPRVQEARRAISRALPPR